MARPQELTEKLLEYTTRPHKLVNVARRFSTYITQNYMINAVTGTYYWGLFQRQAMQRIGDQRVGEIPEGTDAAGVGYELNGYAGTHVRLEKVAGAQFYMENVPVGATVEIQVTTSNNSMYGGYEVAASAPIKEGLNRLTFDEVECSYFNISFTGLAGQTQYINYAVPLGYADSIDDVQYNCITPLINPESTPMPASQIRSFLFPDEGFSESYINSPQNLRNPDYESPATILQRTCSFSVFTNSWGYKDERMVCGIKLQANANSKARLTITAWGYTGQNPTMLASDVEFQQEIVLWFPPTPACQLNFYFEFLDPPLGTYGRRIDFLETYCVNIPGETEEPLTPVSIESIKKTVSVVNPSPASALNIKPVGIAEGVSTNNVALASAGSTVTAYAEDLGGEAVRIIDGLSNTDWMAFVNTLAWLEINFNTPRLITRVVCAYEYMPTDWVIEGMDTNGAWINIATESHPDGFDQTVTYDFPPSLLTRIRYRSTVVFDIHAIYEIKAYEANMVDAPLPVIIGDSVTVTVQSATEMNGVLPANVALASAGSTATADAGTDVDFLPEKAIDGLDTGTNEWISWGPGLGWLEINFNTLRTIARIVIDYDYMPTDWVIEGMDASGAWINIATESRPEGLVQIVTYDFAPVPLTQIRYRSTVPSTLHAIYEIEAYEANMVNVPLPVKIDDSVPISVQAIDPLPVKQMPGQKTVVTAFADAAPADITIAGTTPNWKLVMLGLKFTSSPAFSKDYSIHLKHIPSGIMYALVELTASMNNYHTISVPMELTSDFEIHIVATGLTSTKTLNVVAITEVMP
jgi:hypothetical protein